MRGRSSCLRTRFRFGAPPSVVGFAVLLASSRASGLISPDLPPRTNDGPIRFADLSNASGGPVDFGNPKSDVEKSTCAFFDADGDGWDDLVTLAGIGDGCRFFLNRPDGAGGRTFAAAPAGNGLSDGTPLLRDGASITVADVDGDGDQDVYIGCGWNATLPAGSGRNMLLLNDGTGRTPTSRRNSVSRTATTPRPRASSSTWTSTATSTSSRATRACRRPGRRATGRSTSSATR